MINRRELDSQPFGFSHQIVRRLLFDMDPAKPIIRFCINNPRTLAEREDLIARGIPSRDCLGNCTACFEGRFLEVNSEMVEGESYQEILATDQRVSFDRKDHQ